MQLFSGVQAPPVHSHSCGPQQHVLLPLHRPQQITHAHRRRADRQQHRAVLALQQRRPHATLVVEAAKQPQQEQATASSPLARPSPRVDPFAALKQAQENQDTLQAVVKSINKGGLIASVGDQTGFIPFREMSAQRTQKEDLQDLAYLVGTTIDVKVILVDSEASRVVLSERRVAQSQALKRLKIGDRQRAVVRNVEDYGAFVQLLDVPNVSGLVHRSELSWEKFMNVDDVIKAGDRISVKVLDVDPKMCRASFSIKQLQQDPLTQSLDNAPWGPTMSVPEDIQRVMDRLSAHQSVSEVLALQQATEPHTFSQELQLFLTKAEVRGGYLVLARSGNMLQQLQISTNLSRDEMRELLAEVAKN